MSEIRVKNHFVPESYLKRWEDNNEKVFTYKIVVNHERERVWRCHSTAAIAYQRHLYTQVIAGKESDEFEKLFSKEYESPANEVIDKVISERKLTPEDWTILINFLAAQDVRTPIRLLEHISRSIGTYQETLDDVLNEFKRGLKKGDLKNFKENINSELSNNFPLKVLKEIRPGEKSGVLKIESYVGRSTWLFSIRHVLEHTAKELHVHKWSIVKPAKGYSWFTSDNPVIKLNYTSPSQYDFGGGWGKKKSNIIFPIGPEHAMFVQIGDRPIPKGTRLSVEETKQFRKFIAENAYRKIFSNFSDNEIPSLRPREVNQEKLKIEKENIEKWHKENSKLESEYF